MSNAACTTLTPALASPMRGVRAPFASARAHLPPMPPVPLPAPVTVASAPATPWTHWLLAASQAWSTWRADSARRMELRALAALDQRLLVDLGLGDLATSPRDELAWKELDRARW